MPQHTHGRVPLGLGELARRSPEAMALAAPHCCSLTFHGLVNQIESAGEALRNAGAYAGTATALVLTQGPAAVTAALAIMTGSACAPVESNLTEKEYKDYFGQLRPAALVWDEASNPVAAQAARQLGIGVIGLRVPRDGPAGAFEIVEVSAAASDLDIRQTDQAMIFQTSATTGMPKLVPRSHAALEILARENADVLELNAADRYLNLISLTHAAGPDAIFAQLVSGGSVFCAPGFREDGFVEWLDVFRPTWFLATPTIHRAILLALQRVRPESLARVPLRFVRTGGAPADSELIQLLEQRFGVPVLEGYGLAEVPTVTRNRLSWRKPGSVGRSTGPEISIQTEAGTFLPADAEGEVVLRGPTVMAAYLDNPEANREAFREGWFRTGDIGRMDADGFLFLVGPPQGTHQPRCPEDFSSGSGRCAESASGRCRRCHVRHPTSFVGRRCGGLRDLEGGQMGFGTGTARVHLPSISALQGSAPHLFRSQYPEDGFREAQTAGTHAAIRRGTGGSAPRRRRRTGNIRRTYRDGSPAAGNLGRGARNRTAASR